MHCFFIGRLSGAKGAGVQYSAIDVASATAGRSCTSPRATPAPRWTSELARRVASDPGVPGMAPGEGHERQRLGVPLGGVRPGRGPARGAAPVHPGGEAPTNGVVERVQQPILEECWKPAFARYLIPPKYTGLRLDLERYLRYYNTDRAHPGRWTRGTTQKEVLGKVKMWSR